MLSCLWTRCTVCVPEKNIIISCSISTTESQGPKDAVLFFSRNHRLNDSDDEEDEEGQTKV